jgi:hypothetical protein
VRSFRIPELAYVLMLGCAGAQSAAGSTLLASALTLGLYASHAHGHTASFVSQGGHLHLVLAHADGGDGDAAGAPGPSLSESDHVIHIASDEAGNAASRRPDVAPAAAWTTAAAVPYPSVRPAFQPAPTPQARIGDPLATVVLRL